MRWLFASPLRTMPPLGLVAVGALAGVIGVPVVKKTARSLAVLTVRGVLAVNDTVKGVGSSLSQNWGQMVEEVREQAAMSHTQVPSDMTSLFSMDQSKNVIELPQENDNTPSIDSSKRVKNEKLEH